MILSAHAIVGAAIASMIPESPTMGFMLAFLSHFALDAVPHWDYALRSLSYSRERPLDADMTLGKAFLFDLVKIGADFGIGILLTFLFFAHGGTLLLWAALWGAVGGTAPDALQFVYFKVRREPFTSLQRFHQAVHAKRRLDGKVPEGIARQATVAAVAVLAALFIGR